VSGALRPDFLNLRACIRPLNSILGTVPHVLHDNFGNCVSSLLPESTNATIDVCVQGKPLAKLSAAESQIALLKGMVEAAMEAELRSQESTVLLEAGQLLTADIEALLDLSERDEIPLTGLLSHVLRLLRAHVWAEKAVIFGVLDGYTLEALAGLGWNGDAWRTALSAAAGAAASSLKPHITDSLDSETRNVACFPIVHGSTLLGVVALSNRVGGPFTEAEIILVKRFEKVAAHLLQKHQFKTKMEEFERTNVHLGKYLSKKVVKDVKDKEELQLGGVEKKVVCLFSDIRGYTSITEDISAATLVKLLNFHFERMHAIIEKHEGTLDKIVGDLIMAVWNIPKDQPEPELLAMKAALEMQKEMIRAVIPEWKRHGVEKVGMGVGVNSGLALAGNLGSSRFMNYTVIGDAINTAQRLEAKAQAGEIWMAESMYSLVHGKLEKPLRRELDIRLKGKDKTINALVYKPLQY
jgi:class 3 adenylate cyclase